MVRTLPRRQGCATRGLLCADFAPVARLRVPGGVRHEDWVGTDLSIELAGAARPRVLMITQLYRPGWEAALSNGKTVSGYRLFGGFTGFDLAPNVVAARVSYQPTTRAALTAVTWATIFFGLLAMAGLSLVRRRRS